MHKLSVRVITPRRIVFKGEYESVTAPGEAGEVTILPRHVNFFTVLSEGILTLRKKEGEEDYLAIGGGYLETDGSSVTILVSKAYKQEEIDKHLTEQALKRAKDILKTARDQKERTEAHKILKRSMVHIKLLKKRKKRASVQMTEEQR